MAVVAGELAGVVFNRQSSFGEGKKEMSPATPPFHKV